jgi:hypothetical protein
VPERTEHPHALRGRRLARHEVDGAEERGEAGFTLALDEEVRPESLVEQPGAGCIGIADRLDRSARELCCARRVAREVGELGRARQYRVE